MTNELVPLALTDKQKSEIVGILSVGCDRETAANFVGCSLADVRHAMRSDAQFAESIGRAEASCELAHMSSVQQASKEKGNWRASVWWLEVHAPERYSKREAGSITRSQLRAFVTILVDILSEEMRDAADRARLLARLRAISDSLDELLRDSSSSASARGASNAAALPAPACDNGGSSEDADADGDSWS